MRNAAANFDDDFGLEAPARPKAPRRPAASKSGGAKRKKKGKTRFWVKFDGVPVARYGAIAMSATIVVGILVNALMMQKGHHPAPLFGKSIALGQSGTAAPPAKVAPRPKAPVETAAAPVPTPAETHAATNSAPRADNAPATNEDAIGRLLQGGPVAAEQPSSKTVRGVQQALAKLGFTVKTTGTFGPQTRKAIEHFEKDHHLAVKGEMSKKVVKLLATESGLKIER